MTTEVSKLIWSDIKSTVTGVPLLGRSYPNLGLAVVIFVAVALVLGVSGIGSNNAPAGFVDAQSQGICDRTPAVSGRDTRNVRRRKLYAKTCRRRFGERDHRQCCHI